MERLLFLPLFVICLLVAASVLATPPAVADPTSTESSE